MMSCSASEISSASFFFLVAREDSRAECRRRCDRASFLADEDDDPFCRLFLKAKELRGADVSLERSIISKSKASFKGCSVTMALAVSSSLLV